MILLLVVAALLLLPLTLIVLLPVGFALTSIGSLLTLPGQLVAVALDGRRRRNHALEHATVNVLEQRYGRMLPLSGLAEQDGFYIRGAAEPEVVLEAAREGLRRLQAGEHSLAIHERCGTNLVSGQLISAATFIAVLLWLNLSLSTLLLAMLLAIVAARTLARPVGLFLQRRLTTSGDVGGLHVDRLEATLPENPLVLLLSAGRPTQFRVWTQEVHIEESGPRRYRAY